MDDQATKSIENYADWINGAQEETVNIDDDITGQRWSLRFADRVFAYVWFRKAYHMLGGGLLAAGAFMLDTTWFIALCVTWLVLFGIVSRRISTAVLGLIILTVLTDAKLTIFGAALIFVIGDGIATIAGTAFGRMKLPWHDKKSVAGTLSFLVAGTFAMLIALSILLNCSFQKLAMLAVFPSLAGCLTEALPFALVRDIRDGQPDDNLLVLLISGAVLHWLTKFLQVGAI
jgi:hypothetical protein